MPYYSYPSGVTQEEQPLVEKFERDVLPFVEKHGSEIGEAAMTGNMDAEEVVRRTHLFINGLPEMRAGNFALLVGALKRWEHRRIQ